MQNSKSSTITGSIAVAKPAIMLGENETAIYRQLVNPQAPKLLTLKDAIKYLGREISANSASHTLSFLESKGVLHRIGKGLYINKATGITPRLVEIIPSVLKGNEYYVGLNTAANYWGLTPQIPYAYHAVYIPRNDAERKRVSRWCATLEKKQQQLSTLSLGGILVPVRSELGHYGLSIGRTQTMLEGSQLPISTLEQTLIDAVIYTEEIGGPQEALLWFRNAIALRRDLPPFQNHSDETKKSPILSIKEFRRRLYADQEQLGSILPRVGLLLELVVVTSKRKNTKDNHDDREGFPSVEQMRLLEEIRDSVGRARATFSWGRQSQGGEKGTQQNKAPRLKYIEQWRLHISTDYLKQLRAAS